MRSNADPIRLALDELWGAIDRIDGLTPETVALARSNHELLWHRASGGRVDIKVQIQGGATVTADALTAALASMRACRAQHGQIERPQL